MRTINYNIADDNQLCTKYELVYMSPKQSCDNTVPMVMVKIVSLRIALYTVINCRYNNYR